MVLVPGQDWVVVGANYTSYLIPGESFISQAAATVPSVALSATVKAIAKSHSSAAFTASIKTHVTAEAKAKAGSSGAASIKALVHAQAEARASTSGALSIKARVHTQAEARTGAALSSSLSARVHTQAEAKPSSTSKLTISATVTAEAKANATSTRASQLHAHVTVQTKAMQAVAPPLSSSRLWRTDPIPDANSTYVEAKAKMGWIYETVLLPDNLIMAMNMVVESNLSMSFLGDGPIVAIETEDTNEVAIDTLSITPPGTDTIWNAFKWNDAPWNGTVTNLSPWRLAWDEPLVFKQMSLMASGISETGFQIGNLYLKYQPLGYRQQRRSGVR